MNVRRLTAALGAALLVTGCSAFTLINAASPNRYYDKTEAVEYASDDRHVLDIYKPAKSTEPRPVVVFYYGGGWKTGHRNDYEFVGSALSRAGYVTVIPDYRLFPDVVFPTFVEDGARAFAWVVENIDRFGGDPERIALMGHSAGAHIAALLTLDSSYRESAGVVNARPSAFVGLSGPYDFLPIRSGYLTEVFPPALREASQPIRFAGAHAPRTLLVHGLDDTTVEPDNSRALAEALERSGVDVTLRLYEGQGHRRIAAGLAPPLQFVSDTLDDTVRFLGGESGAE